MAKQQKADRIFFKEQFHGGLFCNIPPGTFLQLKPGSSWPREIDRAIAAGTAQRLSPDDVLPFNTRLTEVGNEHFAEWTRTLPPAPPPPAKLLKKDVLRNLGWGEREWELAQNFGFPRATGQILTGWLVKDDAAPFWSADVVDRWAAQLRELASPMLEKV